MSWDLEGLCVTGMYLNEFPVSGYVVSSRVKYGGGVQHTVVLHEPIQVFQEVRDRILLNHQDVHHVQSNQ